MIGGFMITMEIPSWLDVMNIECRGYSIFATVLAFVSVTFACFSCLRLPSWTIHGRHGGALKSHCNSIAPLRAIDVGAGTTIEIHRKYVKLFLANLTCFEFSFSVLIPKRFLRAFFGAKESAPRKNHRFQCVKFIFASFAFANLSARYSFRNCLVLTRNATSSSSADLYFTISLSANSTNNPGVRVVSHG